MEGLGEVRGTGRRLGAMAEEWDIHSAQRTIGTTCDLTGRSWRQGVDSQNPNLGFGLLLMLGFQFREWSSHTIVRPVVNLLLENKY